MLKKDRYLEIFVYFYAFFLAVAVVFFGFKEFEHINKGTGNVIPIAMALDDGYTYPTIVAMTSMLENKNKNMQYDYYVMHPGEFKEENKEKIKSLEKKYSGCKINLINMADEYKTANLGRHITTPTYYRLSLPDLLPDIDKIIWLDGDTLTLDDLKSMYDIDVEDFYLKGFLSVRLDDFAENNDHYICAGVMLMNLEELRRNDMVNKFNEFIEKNNGRLTMNDQTTINAVCSEKIRLLPAKYGVFSFNDMDHIQRYLKNTVSADKYSEEELLDAFKNPIVLHYATSNKPWGKEGCTYSDKWWGYAEKSGFYSEIKEKYPIF